MWTCSVKQRSHVYEYGKAFCLRKVEFLNSLCRSCLRCSVSSNWSTLFLGTRLLSVCKQHSWREYTETEKKHRLCGWYRDNNSHFYVVVFFPYRIICHIFMVEVHKHLSITQFNQTRFLDTTRIKDGFQKCHISSIICTLYFCLDPTSNSAICIKRMWCISVILDSKS